MKNVNSRTMWYTVLLFAGAVLFIFAELMEVIDSFWGGMGIGFIVLSVLRLVQISRYKNNEEYAKKLTIANNDERNHFLNTKARATSLYYSILLEAILIIFLYIVDMSEVAQVITMVLCGQLIIYWVSYAFIKSKY